jgi:hypothetical protein
MTGLGMLPEDDPEDSRTVDVGLASTQYNAQRADPTIAKATAAAGTAADAKISRTREVVILGAFFAGLFALERILGRRGHKRGMTRESGKDVLTGAGGSMAAKAFGV